MVDRKVSDGGTAALTEMGGQAAQAHDLGPLPDYVGYNLRRAQVASFKHLDRIAGALELSPGQFSLLVFLKANPGVSQKSVSHAFGVDTSTLSPVLAMLSARGLVHRKRASHDRRNYAISLTADGRRHLADMRAHIEAQEALMGDALDPGEREMLLRMLRKVAAALEPG
ncbi:MAG TPA: MarR family winged helix-turn-helix transcriptional regulator [Alphaproteobacteria bacterium]|nr:MarR family winged helix-turn-helix transcriptional regulator [Alphaproteobacteria bacterium]